MSLKEGEGEFVADQCGQGRLHGEAGTMSLVTV